MRCGPNKEGSYNKTDDTRVDLDSEFKSDFIIDARLCEDSSAQTYIGSFIDIFSNPQFDKCGACYALWAILKV